MRLQNIEKFFGIRNWRSDFQVWIFNNVELAKNFNGSVQNQARLRNLDR